MQHAAPAGAPAPAMAPIRGDLDALFNPRSIAIIGASSDARKIGGRPIRFLMEMKFAGPIYPVNPNQTEIQGLRAYKSLDAIEGDIDQVIIALPAPAVPAAVDVCIARGVRAIVLFSAGFAELDEAGQRVQEAIAQRCAANNVRLLGPNCLGLASIVTGAFSTFSHSIEFAIPLPGKIAVASQSGAVGTYLLVNGVRRGLRFSRFVATGNEADVDVAECIEWFAGDPATRVILAYMEATRDGRRLREALQLARRAGKPVILLKADRLTSGQPPRRPHTGALAGNRAAYDAVFQAAGAYHAQSMEEMLDVAYACSLVEPPAGSRMVVVTNSGGLGVMLADAAAKHGISMPPLSAEAQARIRALLPFAGTANPVDTTAQILNDFTLLQRTLSDLLTADPFDIVVVFMGTIGLDPNFTERMLSLLIAVRRAHPERLLAVCTLPLPEVRERLEAENVLVFEDPTRLVAAVGGMLAIKRLRAIAEPESAPAASTVRLEWPAQGPDEAAASALLSEAGVKFVPSRMAENAADAVAAAEGLGFPVALKVVSADITHKSDVGGVRLNLGDAAAVADAFDGIMTAVRAARPDADLRGALVTPMVRDGVELIMGVQNDPTFGPVALVGLGGIHVELLGDVQLGLAPVDLAEAERMIRRLQGFPLLAGARGRTPVDLTAAAAALAALSRFAAVHADQIANVEVNPFIALPTGGYAVDALIVPKPENSHT